MLHRLFLTLITIVFPPLTVLMITGPYTDTLINCILFLCGVIPSHIHAFYISCTYFHRKRKVRKGKWPGPPKTLIFDRKVWYGGASEWEAEELKGVGSRSRGTSPTLRDGRRSSQRRRSGWEDNRKPVLSKRRPSGRTRGGDVRYYGRSEIEGSAYDRRSQSGVAGYDRRSQGSDGLDRRRSVMGEIGRRY